MKYVTNKQLTTYISLPYGKPLPSALIPEKEVAEQQNSPPKTEIGLTLLKTSPRAALLRPMTPSPLSATEPREGIVAYSYTGEADFLRQTGLRFLL